MLTVTDAAAARLHEMTNNGPEDKTIRLELDGARFEFQWDQEKPGDHAISHDGDTILIFDEHVAGLVGDRTMEVQQTDKGSALMLS